MRVHHEVIYLTSHLKFLRSVRSVCMCVFLVPSHKSTVQSQRADRASTCYMLSHCVTSDSATPWTVAHQAPLSMGFSRQEYWSGLSCPPQRDLPNPGTELTSPALAGRFFTTSATWEALAVGILRYPESITKYCI